MVGRCRDELPLQKRATTGAVCLWGRLVVGGEAHVTNTTYASHLVRIMPGNDADAQSARASHVHTPLWQGRWLPLRRACGTSANPTPPIHGISPPCQVCLTGGACTHTLKLVQLHSNLMPSSTDGQRPGTSSKAPERMQYGAKGSGSVPRKCRHTEEWRVTAHSNTSLHTQWWAKPPQ